MKIVTFHIKYTPLKHSLIMTPKEKKNIYSDLYLLEEKYSDIVKNQTIIGMIN